MARSTLVQQEADILPVLRGQSIVLPDLNSVLGGWPREVNQNLKQLRRDVDQWLDSAMSHNSRLSSLKAADFAFLGANWWPRANYERLRIATLLAVWIFVWDDDIDMDSCALWDKRELFDQYRDETSSHVRACMGLTTDPCRGASKSTSATIQAFEPIGKAIRRAYSHEQRRRFMTHFEHYMDMTQQEQMLRFRRTLPSVEEYWTYRLGSSAVHVIIAVNEFVWDNKGLSKSVMEDSDMKLLWIYTNIITSTVNDIVSLKKEIAQGNIGSMIPLVYARSRDIQQAVDQTTDFLAANIRSFEDTTQRLERLGEETTAQEALALCDFIKQCQFYCTGNLTWSLTTRRYGICENDLATGVRVTL